MPESKIHSALNSSRSSLLYLLGPMIRGRILFYSQGPRLQDDTCAETNTSARTDRTTGAAIRGLHLQKAGHAELDIRTAHNRLALHFSDVRLRGPVRLNLSSDVHEDPPLSWLFGVPRGSDERGLSGRRPVRTLWLSGTHRRSGVDLELALDAKIGGISDRGFHS